MNVRVLWLLAALAAACLTGGPAYAQDVPDSINYQGKLTDAAGVPVPDASYQVQFKLYTAETDGDLLWDSGAMNVDTFGGVFTAQLGPITSGNLSQAEVWLQVTVGADPPLARVKLSSAPFALRAQDVVLPYAGSISGNPYAFKVTNTGGGRAVYGVNSGSGGAGYFEINNATSAANSLFAGTVGTGRAGQFDILNIGNTSAALWARTTGSGPAFKATPGSGLAGMFEGAVEMTGFKLPTGATDGYVLTSDPSGSGTWQAAPGGGLTLPYSDSVSSSVYALSLTNTGTGGGGYFETTSSDTDKRALIAKTTGSGSAGYFEIDNAGSNSPALSASTNATETAIIGYTSGSGRAGWFETNNAANSEATIYAVTNGSGPALDVTAGTGYAAKFHGNVAILDSSSGATVMELGTGLDYAEGFDVSDKSRVSSGAVMVIDPQNPGKLTVATEPYDRKVAGIVAGGKDLQSGVRLGAGQFDYDVALAGRVFCNVDATRDAVEPGDLMTTSSTPGYAMKVTDYTRAQGAILGKAMQNLEQGKRGQILVLVTLQ